MPCARDDGTAQGKHDVLWLVFSYPERSHHPLRAVFSAISNKAYKMKYDYFMTEQVVSAFRGLCFPQYDTKLTTK